MIPILSIPGATATGSTVALNLAIALSSIGGPVEIVDLDPARRIGRALLQADGPGSGAPPRAGEASSRTFVLDSGAGLGLPFVGPGSDGDVGVAVRPALRISVGGALPSAASGADLVLVPLDASDAARRALEAAASHVEAIVVRGDSTAVLRVVMSRRLPRSADRWRLVEEIAERYANALYPVTVPMGRSTGEVAGAAPAAMLYTPTGRAAASYRALARLAAADLGVAYSPAARAPDERSRPPA